MMRLRSLVYFCTIFIGITRAQDFKAAVVEYYPPLYEQPVIPETRLMNNVLKYKELASKNPNNYDIIVFPESTLHTGTSYKTASDAFPYSTIVPEVYSNIVACDDTEYKYASFFRELSCLAKDIKKHVVINLVENVPCRGNENCPEFGFDVYNTNVVFNDQGKVVAKYQKFNLFGEYYMTKPEKQLATFELKPGLKIGMFICFDIMFKQPALELIQQEKIQAAVYPLMWFSELPFLTALQAQQQWARELNIILLAAGANNASAGSGGSGIFKGKEGLQDGSITSEKVSKVFYAEITADKAVTIFKKSVKEIDAEAKSMDSFHLLKDNLKSYTSKLLDPKEQTVETQVCNGDGPNKICCDFVITTTVDGDVLNDNKNHYQYHLVAFSGVRTFSGVASGGIETCAVVACLNDSLDSCGKRFESYDSISWPLTFTKIEVKAKYVKDEHRIQFPNSLLSNLKPLDIEASEWITTDDTHSVERKHILKQSQERLLTFGIFGRDFSRDGKDVTQPPKPPKEEEKKGGGSGFIKLHYIAIVAACLIFLLNIFSC